MKITMRFEGGQELAAALQGLSTRITRKILTEALLDAAEPMRKTAARFAPREPGAPDMADNIIAAANNRSARDQQESVVAVGPSKPFYYGVFQEYGTVRHGAQPFMRPAFDATHQKALDDLRERLWTILASRGVIRTATVSVPVSGPGRLT